MDKELLKGIKPHFTGQQISIDVVVVPKRKPVFYVSVTTDILHIGK